MTANAMPTETKYNQLCLAFWTCLQLERFVPLHHGCENYADSLVISSPNYRSPLLGCCRMKMTCRGRT
jgi:hypothetical protein